MSAVQGASVILQKSTTKCLLEQHSGQPGVYDKVVWNGSVQPVGLQDELFLDISVLPFLSHAGLP